MRRFKDLIKIVLIGYVLIAIMLHFLQEKLIFLPTQLPQDYQYSFEHPFEEIFLETDDGAVLNALHFKKPNSKGVILYFHGNAGDLSRWGGIVSYFVEMDYDVVVMDYRTYGKSKGKLSENALHTDAERFHDYVLRYYEEDEVVLFGRSLGTGIAVRLASVHRPRMLLLETPYYSLEDVAQKRFPLLPVKWLLKYKLKSYEQIPKVRCPIVIFHGTEDTIIPLESGKKLYQSISGSPGEMVVIEGGAHNNLVDFESYRKKIREVLQ